MALTDSNTTMLVSPTGNGGFGGFGGDWGWIILLLLFAGGGWGMGGGYGGGYDFPWILNGQNNINANTNNGFRDAMLNDGITSVRGGLADISTQLCGGFAGVNAAIANGFAQSEIADNSRQMANMNQIFGISQQLSQCCCDNRLATCQTQNIVQSEGAATRLAIQNQTQAILDKMCQQEIDAKNDRIGELERQLNFANLNASQTAQTAAIISALTPAALVASK